MGAFWIFAAILTFVYIVYYAVMIGNDLLGGKDKKKNDVEVFSVGSDSENQNKALDEEPVDVQDEDNISDASSSAAATLSAAQDTSSPDNADSTPPQTDSIKSPSTDQLYQAIKAAEAQMSAVHTEAQSEVSGDEYDNTRLAMLMAAGEETIEKI